MKKSIAFLFSVALISCAFNSTSQATLDPETGLKIAPGWEAVKTRCTACHSAKLIISQQGDRKAWLKTIRRMQDVQGLGKLDAKTEDRILRYLSENYPPGRSVRRANLPPEALPPNPWQHRSDSN